MTYNDKYFIRTGLRDSEILLDKIRNSGLDKKDQDDLIDFLGVLTIAMTRFRSWEAIHLMSEILADRSRQLMQIIGEIDEKYGAE